MVWSKLASIIGLFGLIFIVIFLIKNYLIDLKQSDSSSKNALLLIACIFVLLSSALLMGVGIDLGGTLYRLATEAQTLTAKEIEILQLRKRQFQSAAITLSVIQFCGLGIVLFTFKSLISELKKKTLTQKRHWDWDKI